MVKHIMLGHSALQPQEQSSPSLMVPYTSAELKLVVCIASKEAMCWQRGCKAQETLLQNSNGFLTMEPCFSLLA